MFSFLFLILVGFSLAVFVGAGFQLGVLFMNGLISESKVGNRDDTDGEKRSNLILMTDHGTGRQYLMSPTGHLVPREKAE